MPYWRRQEPKVRIAVMGELQPNHKPSLASACREVLTIAEPRAKLMRARRAARDWRLGRLTHEFDVAMPDYPARPEKPELLPPSQMPKRGKAGSLRARVNMLHALAHICHRSGL